MKIMPVSIVWRAAMMILFAAIAVALPSCRSVKDSHHSDAMMIMPVSSGNLWASIIHECLVYGRQKSRRPSESQASLKYLLDLKKDNSKFHAMLSQCVASLDEAMPYDQMIVQLAQTLAQPQTSPRDPYTQSRWCLFRAMCLAEVRQLNPAIDSAMEAEVADENKDWRVSLQLSWLYNVSGQLETSNMYYQKAVSYGAPAVPQSPYRSH